MDDLHLKYRPMSLEAVLGHEEIVDSLQEVLNEGNCHAFCFTGPSGVGKTTLARIVANVVGCRKKNLLEIDAATHNGVEAMRDLTDSLNYAPLGGGVKVVIMDEAHALSKAAWQSLLKMVEEPPPHVYWCFCTTESSKVPQTIKTRCVTYELRDVSLEDISELVTHVAAEEGYELEEDILEFIAETAMGSPRQALTSLSACRACESVKEAAKILDKVTEDGDVIHLCRALMKPLSWAQAMNLVRPLQGQNPEGLRMIIVSYYTKVALGAKSEKGALPALAVLEAFSEPYPTTPSLYPLLLSLGELIVQ